MNFTELEIFVNFLVKANVQFQVEYDNNVKINLTNHHVDQGKFSDDLSFHFTRAGKFIEGMMLKDDELDSVNLLFYTSRL